MPQVFVPQMDQFPNKTLNMSSQTKLSKEKQNLQSTNKRPNSNSNNVNSTATTTPMDSVNHHQHQQQLYCSSDSSTITNSVPQSPTPQLLDFDDFTSTSSIMEFLRQEQNCYQAGGDTMTNGHDCEVDAESIFQEVSRLADNTDTRSVEELLREAELLLQHQNFMGDIRPTENKQTKPKTKIVAGDVKLTTSNSTTIPVVPQATTIQMNSKYTKSIENVHPRDTLIKLINGYVPASTPLDDCSPPLMTPETPTVTYSLSDVGAGGGGGNTFNNFVNNIPSESVISEESPLVELPEENTATLNQCSSNDNTTKDMTTKNLMDGDDDTDDGTDTVS